MMLPFFLISKSPIGNEVVIPLLSHVGRGYNSMKQRVTIDAFYCK
jgi:hypothetical protein